MAKINRKNIYPDDLNPSLLDYLLGSNANSNNKTQSYPLQLIADLIKDYIIEHVDGMDQDNKFRIIEWKFVIGGPGVDLSTEELREAAIAFEINDYLQNHSIEVLEKELIIFSFQITEYGVYTTHNRKYLFPSMLGKGVYSPMSSQFQFSDIKIIYVDNKFYNTTPIDIENSINNVVFDLGDITGQNYLTYLNTISNILYPTGYPLIDNTKIYYIKYTDNDVIYMYFFDEENSLNSYGFYGVDGVFQFEPTDLVLFYNSSNIPAPLNPIDTTANHTKGNYDIITNTPPLTNGFGQIGDEYICTNPGTRDFGIGNVTVKQNDILSYDGGNWFLKVNNNQTNGVVPKIKTLTSADLTTQDITGFLAYADALSPNLVIASNEFYDFHVTDTGQIFSYKKSGVTIGVGQTAILSSDVLDNSEYVFKTNTHLAHHARWKAIGGTSATTLEQIGAFLNYPVIYTGTKQNPSTSSVFFYENLLYRSAATAGASCGFSTGNGSVFPATLSEGFDFEIKFGTSSLASVSTSSLFVGLCKSTTDIGNINPSTLLNCIGIGNDENDANLRLIHNDATGTATYTDLGVNFPANTINQWYFLRIVKPVGSTSKYFWHLKRYSDNPTNIVPIAETSGYVSTDLPVVASANAIAWHIHRCNRSTASAVEIAAHMVSLFKCL